MTQSIDPLPRYDALRVVAGVLLPLVAQGLILRRRRTVDLLDHLDADARALSVLRELRDRRGRRPLRLRLGGRDLAIVLSAADARRILDGSPDDFAIANLEKRAALGRFQPHGLLVSPAEDRPPRRRFNEQILGAGCPRHRLAESIAATVAQEASEMLSVAARQAGVLDWDVFARHWWRLVRRVVLGGQAREDSRLTDLLGALRAGANWAYLAPRRRRTRDEFLARLRTHLARAEPGSLAELVAEARAPRGVHADEQVPQWLFAFDGAAMATMRALVLLQSRPTAAGGDAATGPERLRPYLLESLRLWPTTPAILRDAVGESAWDGRTLPAGTALLIYAPLLHRDDAHLAEPDGFHPELWQPGIADPPWAVPFSGGPGACPGRDLVTAIATTMLAALAEHTSPAAGSALGSGRPLPATLSPFRLRFRVAAGTRT
jgi:cytochrome P450